MPGIEGELGGVLEGGEEVCVKEAIPSIVAGIVGCQGPSAPRPGAPRGRNWKLEGRTDEWERGRCAAVEQGKGDEERERGRREGRRGREILEIESRPMKRMGESVEEGKLRGKI